MSTWSFADAQGRFIGAEYAGPQADLQANTPPGCVAVPGRVDHQRWRLGADGQLQAVPVDLAALKEQAWGTIKAQRSALLAGTFSAGGRVYQVDRENIPGAALDALRAQLAGEPWQQAWVLADNTSVTLNAADMMAVGRALRQYVSALWATSEALRAQVNAATTAAALAAITWPN